MNTEYRLSVTLFATSLFLLVSGCGGSSRYDSSGNLKRFKDECKQIVSKERSRANEGSVYTQMTLGRRYFNGGGCTNRDYKESMKWFRMADQKGDIYAPNYIGTMYHKGWGVPKDVREAEKWFRKGFEQGELEATANLGLLYYEDKKYSEAVPLFRKAADGKNHRGQYYLGLSYYGGFGVKQDFHEAERLLLKAAFSRHFSGANYILGRIYEKGLTGPRNIKAAMYRYEQASRKGHLKAGAALVRLKRETEWSHRDKFITMFPSPQTGWTAGKLDIKELKVPTTDFESFVSGISGTKVAPHVRLQVIRRYYRTQENWMEMAIDTYDPKTASTIKLMFENQEIRDKMAKEGAKTLMVGKSRAISGDRGKEKGLIMKVGNVGIVALACRYQDCDKDMELYSKRLNLAKITRFAKYLHRKSE